MQSYLFSFFILLMIQPLACFAAETQESALAFLNQTMPSSNHRYQTLAHAILLMAERGVKTIVETGTTRGVNLQHIMDGDGGGTIFFGEWAYRNGAIMYTVDINPTAFSNAAPFLKHFENHLVKVCSDSVEFLENFSDTIDFLYLDSFDFDFNDPYPSQEHHLKEIIAAYPKLTPNSIILIDDCGLPHGGKGKLVIEYLRNLGWEIVAQGYQVLLIKRKV